MLPIGNRSDPMVVLPKLFFTPKGTAVGHWKPVAPNEYTEDSNRVAPTAVFLGSVIVLGRFTFIICSVPPVSILKAQNANEGVEVNKSTVRISRLGVINVHVI